MFIIKKYHAWKLKRHIKKFGSKNMGYFNYFDNAWFEKHQRQILFLLNHWLLKYWFRRVLRINKDCKPSEFIDRILPHTYRVKLNNNLYRSDFRSHPKFSKRIYYAFRPLWWPLHYLDWVLQNILCVDFNFGFDTLSAYPDAGSGNTTVDGYMVSSVISADFSEVRNSAGHSTDYSATYLTSFPARVQTDGGYNFTGFHRLKISFDTSSLGNNVVITSAAFSTYGKYKVFNLGNIESYLVSHAGSANTIAPADFNINNFGTAVFASIDYLQMVLNQYNEWSGLTEAGINHINKTGITVFGALSHWEFNNSFTGTLLPSSASYYIVSSSDVAGITEDPKLVIIYSISAVGNKIQMII